MALEVSASPVLRHSCSIINGKSEEIRKTERKTRNLLTMHKMHHPKAKIDRLYIRNKNRNKAATN
jgi:hypothetical protein